MLAFVSQYFGSAIVLLLLGLVVFLAIRSLVRDKKAGKGFCGGNCSSCHLCQHSVMSDEEIREIIEKKKSEQNEK